MLFYRQFLHVQLSSFHSFINLLDFATDGESFIVSGRLQRTLPPEVNELVP